jgi:Bacteriophage protein gp37
VQTAEVNRKVPALVYPFGFEPTFYPDRLSEPSKLKKPSTIFVGSMCDMWGDWVPDEWIVPIMEQTLPKRHRWLFLTKNPSRYYAMQDRSMYGMHYGDYKNCWFGASITTSNEASTHSDTMFTLDLPHKFFSAEPLLEDIAPHVDFEGVQWLIIGALTKNGRVVSPERGGTRAEWIKSLAEKANKAKIPVFFKDSAYKLFPEIPYDVWIRDLPYLEGR